MVTCGAQKDNSDSEDFSSDFTLCIFFALSPLFDKIIFSYLSASHLSSSSINKPSFPDESLQFIIKLEDEMGLFFSFAFFFFNNEINYYQQDISPL